MAKHLGVKYLYEQDQTEEERSRPEPEVTAAQLAVLPGELRRELHDALLRLDMVRTMEVIERISERDALLGTALRAVTENLDYHGLLRLLEQED